MASTTGVEVYKKHTHREHILELPDTYVGSVETAARGRWIYDGTAAKMVWRSGVQFNPGLYKIFDEIIVNARDAFVRSGQEGRQPVKRIDVVVGSSSSADGPLISVENDGDGIPIELHETEGVYVPEMIFGHLLTSSNYNKEEEKIVGGKNGYGAKLCNVFSRRFMVDIKSATSGRAYTQTWRNNMSVCEKPSVRKATGIRGHVRVEFEPDVTRFKGGFTEDGDGVRLSPDMIAVFQTRVVELAAMVGSGVKVSWNGEVVSCNSFEKYIKLFLREGMTGLAFENCGPRWEVGCVLTRHLYTEADSGAAELPEERHISFVNGIMTAKGGTHVGAVSGAVLKEFCEEAKKKKVEIKPAQMKDSVVFFVNATIVNPSFDSQTKECLTTPPGKFGSVFRIGEKFVDKLIKLGLLDEARAVLEARAAKDAKKTDGKKRVTLRGMPKLEDALWAGTPRSEECTLILTEGDSAATSAISGLNVVGREKWGVFPLRGKLLNVKDISVQKFNDNEELTAIKRILGLEHGKEYTTRKQLRYGRVMIMADQDHDGSHIKGLIMNLFHTEWPSLLRTGFICTLLTPLLKAFRGSTVVPFYTQQEYDAWLAAGNCGRGWHVKYYKGLGTSTPAEAREWFRDLHEIRYTWDRDSDEAISLAFNKKRADDRKRWLGAYDPMRTAVVAGGAVGYSGFIHGELIHFSNADNIRSLPHIMDGLKPSQRKILYSCIKRNLRSEIRVAQLSGYVSEHAAYHHGEASLNSTIIGMAQNFVGSNNINLLRPNGQFGSRLLGGKDAASPRYIHTQLENIVDALFKKEDNCLLRWQEDDGQKVEPETYLPVVPFLAINGCEGIGTGYSTSIPPYNPESVAKLIRCRLAGDPETLAGRKLDPWWFGFRGEVVRLDEVTWATKGRWQLDEARQAVVVTELPVGMWTKTYKEFLDELVTREGGNPFGLKGFDDLYNDIDVNFVLYFKEDAYDEIEHSRAQFEKNFKLVTTFKTTNMCCFVPRTDGGEGLVIEKFGCIGDILERFVELRLPAYAERRDRMLVALRREITELEARRAFLQAVLDGRLELMRRTDDEIVEGLKRCGIPALSDPERADVVEGYDYVLRMRIDRVKASAIAELDKEVAEKRAEIERLERETPSTMWMSDIRAFEEAWREYCSAREESTKKGTAGVIGGSGAGKRKKTAAAVATKK